jgi:hypothetical protein
VVAPEHEEVFRVLELVSHAERHRFDRLFATVDVVAQEEVVGIWREPCKLKQPQHVVVLPMHVSNNLVVRERVLVQMQMHIQAR